MADEVKVSAVEAWERSLRAISGLIKVFDKELQHELDMPLGWYDVIVHLAQALEGKLRMQALADAVILPSSGQTRLIDRIEKAGLVRREPAAEDRRGYYVVLTEEGWRMHERAQLVHGGDIEKNFTRFLDDDDVQALHSIMNKLWNENPNLGGSSPGK